MGTAEGKEVIVRFEGVGLKYPAGPEILDDVSFELEDGAFHFLTGPSGAGKTTLLRLMYLAMRPTSGRITLFGDDTAKASRARLPALRRRIGVVFQDFRLLDHLSTFDNVALPLRIAGCHESDVREHVVDLLSWVGLEKHLEALPQALSGGQQQLVATARAVVGRPKLLICDEPTGNVDDHIAVRLMHLFQELNRLGTTVVVATHNRTLAGRIGHRRLRMEHGRLWMEHPKVPEQANGGSGTPRPTEAPAIEGIA
jgi:cell division transport system ATP-binding protein